MLFGERLSLVRKRKKISQDELAKMIGVHAPVIGRYERGEVKPSIEVATKIADSLAVSLDYLVGHSDLLIEHATLDKIMDIQNLTEKDQEHLFAMIDAFLRDAKTRKAYA
ncbi:MAG: helix-turn-helix domain-containing protein [Cyclobacteriaceae bacterium]